jgi:hypothetical protein
VLLASESESGLIASLNLRSKLNVGNKINEMYQTGCYVSGPKSAESVVFTTCRTAGLGYVRIVATGTNPREVAVGVHTLRLEGGLA